MGHSCITVSSSEEVAHSHLVSGMSKMIMKNNSCNLEACVNLDLAIDYLVNIIRPIVLYR